MISDFLADHSQIIYQTLYGYTVKLARAKLPAATAGKLFRRQNYQRMQAKFSAGNVCLRFPQVTDDNLPAPAGNLREEFCVCVLGWTFSNAGTFSFDQYYTTFLSNQLLPLKTMVDTSKLIPFQKR